ncbi:Abortive infection bacteriophage resistance protein [Kytococcus aerolatus]|uniref:Abortive infection bacteriophage resistance protein n=1 Tax=Kytococcus aerolatus TaxID=592308 RepID=A0A212TCY1_9MICO|nr:Abortive infection bacteriophage resistance protein [Kytococcus aerolatus]
MPRLTSFSENQTLTPNSSSRSWSSLVSEPVSESVGGRESWVHQGCWCPARDWAAGGERGDRFVAGTRFEDAVALYEADRKLRTLVHDGMERVEILLRTRVGERLCATGPLGHEDQGRFRPSFQHKAWMATADKRISRAQKHSDPVRHHQRRYGGRYPFWVLAEVLDMADVSKLFEGMKAGEQRAIVEGVGFAVDSGQLTRNQQKKFKAASPLAPWLHQLTVVRNTCAHQGRLWNRSFAPAPTAALRTLTRFRDLPQGQSERIFGALTVMSHLVQAASPGSTWADRVADHLATAFLPNPLVVPGALGIPDTWSGQLGGSSSPPRLTS